MVQTSSSSSSSSSPALSDLIFPTAAGHNFSHILTDLKRANLSIANRLRSIAQDADFVAEAAACFGGRPLVANERCGSWYVRPADKRASAYFKSTDGHTNAWKFSTRRLNLHLLELIGEHDGCIIVDSTRRGKRMPDALSKTIPVWCAVLNMALFPDLPHADRLFTPPNVVSASEHAQIAALLPSFLAALRALEIDPAPLRARLAKPLRPFWVTQETQLSPAAAAAGAVFDDYHPVICCTASRRVAGAEMSEAGYIQGAGDDTENWALGLTAELFWEHAGALLSAPEADLPDAVAALVAERKRNAPRGVPAKRVAPRILVRPLPLEEDETSVVTYTLVASRNLRQALPDICAFVARHLGAHRDADVVIACESGRDLSIGAALAVYCWCFDQDGGYRVADASTFFNKDMIRVRLGTIMTAFPEANANRATLQSVNSFLMDHRR
ncbi:initiator tRNA phosphoribosyl transferase [Colletotrichum graminicola M1.001]|uniref:Initiator tRNA phosphoribosyl transferase n=1 Tax=Colletotrichum graminicola (strain M1.001 / M2 / FGSC 10212) TaxID=645133 RepID=E3QAS1_COLGM|nr:initiator tRNA phosphoribosyl transferase [Colletotrichum graminicola M1.001]EFQ27959.1 initiator tRNA phosphoribosyl transferase [Colletotrichum graminicola M1.001]